MFQQIRQIYKPAVYDRYKDITSILFMRLVERGWVRIE